MPAKGKSRVTAAQRRQIAEGRLKGKTRKMIAQETGLSPKTVGNQGIDARTVTLMQEIKAKAEKPLTAGINRGIARLGRLIGHKEPHVAIRAYRELHRTVLEGDPPPRRIDPARSREGGATLAELLVLYKKFDEGPA